MKLVVKNNNGQKFTLQIRPNETFLDLKRRVELESGISLDLRDITTNKRNINETQRVIDYFLNEQNQQSVQHIPPEVICAVPTCDNRKSLNPNKSYFDFPEEEIRCHQWVLYCRRIAARLSPDNPKANLPVNVGSPGTAICSDHFKVDQFVKNTTTLLKRTAVPCVNPELPSAIPESHVPAVKNPGPFVKNPNHVSSARNYPSSRPYWDTKYTPPYKVRSPQKSRTPNILQDSLSSSHSSPSASIFGSSSVNLTCRLCANPSRNTVFIYSREGKSMMLAEKICASLPIRVKMTDRLPKQVCRTCIDKLNSAFYLVEVSTTTDEGFRAGEKKRREAMEEKLAQGECPCCIDGRLQLVAGDSEERTHSKEAPFAELLPEEQPMQAPEQITDVLNEGCDNDGGIQLDAVGNMIII